MWLNRPKRTPVSPFLPGRRTSASWQRARCAVSSFSTSTTGTTTPCTSYPVIVTWMFSWVRTPPKIYSRSCFKSWTNPERDRGGYQMIPERINRETGRYALVDGIPFQMPVEGKNSPALMAIYTIDADKAQALLPGNEIHPLRLGQRALLVITVIEYLDTNIGKYIEFSIAIACTHGAKEAPSLLPALFMKPFGTGQYVYDLPVSTEISVKGGKGIWGMPKHQAGLDFLDGEDWVSSQYDLDGRLAMRIDVKRPSITRIPISMSATNYCRFRGMLMASYIHLDTRFGLSLFRRDSARLTIGDHPRLRPIKELEIDPHPVFTAYFPSIQGVLDDHFECWFLSYDTPPKSYGEGMESVIKLGLSQEWPPAPKRENKEMN